jgi:hypothetical protein
MGPTNPHLLGCSLEAVYMCFYQILAALYCFSLPLGIGSTAM